MPNWQAKLDVLQQDPRTPIVLTLLFAVLLLWAALDFLAVFFQTSPKIPSTATTTTSQPTENLADFHPFGVYSAALTNLPTTQLQLTLEGTIVMLGTPDDSEALISSPNEPTKVYRIGDTLPGNATIMHIHKHYVVLNENGMMQKLPLPIETIMASE